MLKFNLSTYNIIKKYNFTKQFEKEFLNFIEISEVEIKKLHKNVPKEIKMLLNFR